MLRIERTFQDREGRSFRVDVILQDEGPVLEAEIQRLVNKAKDSVRRKARSAGGVVFVTVHPVGK